MGRSPSPYHVPVMADRVVELFADISPGLVVDATFGGGGHTDALLEALPELRVLALDRDHDTSPGRSGRVTLLHRDFRDLESVLAEEGIDEIDGALLDLGVSSHQLDVGERGFSYRSRGPLDMRMGPDAAVRAEHVVNEYPIDELRRIIARFGEERFAGRISRAIVAARPIEDTEHLAGIVAGAVPARARDRGHPARRTFQAIRIAVNDELAALPLALDAALRVLRGGGRLVVISYHSLEDRIVKRRFAAGATGCTCPPDLPVCACDGVAELRLLNRRVERPTPEEVASNPRARSARLRAVEKV